MKKEVTFWVEKYFYNPSTFQKLLSILLLPLSWLYCFGMYVRFQLQKEKDFGIDIISVGNLNVGGSGKTPLVTALAKEYEDVAIILRGYGRKSHGLYVVKNRDKILVDVQISGDEAMIYAQKVPNAIVIVSEDRKEGIERAKEIGAKQIFLDDAYSKHKIKKRDIIINVESKNSACLPSGPFRERLWKSTNRRVIYEDVDFKRHVTLKNSTKKMVLVTAIARPERLDAFLPMVIAKYYFHDHYSFNKEELLEIIEKEDADSLLVTYKDFVKIQSFGIPLSLLDLDVEVNTSLLDFINS